MQQVIASRKTSIPVSAVIAHIPIGEWFVVLAPVWMMHEIGWLLIGILWMVIASGAAINGALTRIEYEQHKVV